MGDTGCALPPRFKQYQCAFTGTLLFASMTFYLVWPSPVIPHLVSSDSPIGVQLTKEESSWIASALSLGMLPASVFAGHISDRIGRKRALLASGVLLVLPWLLITFAKSFAVLLVGRIVGGFGSAIVIAVLSIYIGEIAENDIRGRLNIIPVIGALVASTLVLSVGPFVSYVTLSIMCALPAVLGSIACIFLPESPFYLVKSNKKSDALEVLKTLSQEDVARKRMMEIERTVIEDEEQKFTLKTLFYEADYRKCLIIIIGMKTIDQFSGVYAINTYMQQIMEASQTNLSPEASSAILSTTQIPSFILSCYLIDKLGRRPLLIMSALGCAVSLFGEGLYFYLKQVHAVDLTNVFFIPTMFLGVYYIAIALGITYLSNIVMGEICKTNVKNVGGSLFAFYTGLLNFITIKIFSPISEAWGMYTVFWMFAAFCVLAVLFGFFVLPETKGISFEEIQEILGGSKPPKRRATTK